MTDLFWPGDHRAGTLMSDRALLAAMVAVEQAWLDTLIGARIAPESAPTDLGEHLADGDLESIARGAEVDGNPVTGLVALLRERTEQPTAQWLHRGLTSQDVVDTALMLCVRDALARIREELADQVRTLSRLAEIHRATPMLARTLTQAALPSTARCESGAVAVRGTGRRGNTCRAEAAGPGRRCGGHPGRGRRADRLGGRCDEPERSLAVALRLEPSPPWHTTRSVVTRIGDALATCCDAWGYSPPTSPPAVGLRSVSWPNRAGAGHRRCPTRTIRCARC